MTRRIAARVVLPLIALVFLPACRSAHGPTDLFAGTWSGTIVDDRSGAGALQLTLTREGPGVAGTWASTFDTGAAARGTLSGTIEGTNASLFLKPEVGILCAPANLPLSATMAVSASVTNDRLLGTYVVFLCEGTGTGSLDLRRAP
jgi:hypothetical protein